MSLIRLKYYCLHKKNKKFNHKKYPGDLRAEKVGKICNKV